MANPTNVATERTPERARERDTGTLHSVTQHIPRARTHSITTLGRRRASPQSTAASLTTGANIALAGLELVIGYQWLVSGVDKLLLGSFPAQVGHMLMVQVGSGRLPALFAALLRALVVPNAPLFGYAIMLGETLAGLGLIAAGVFMLVRPAMETHVKGRLWAVFAMTDRIVTNLAPLAAAGAGLLGLSYYLLDGAPTLWFTPSLAYGGAVAPGMVVALASLVIVVAHVFPARTPR